MKLVTTFVLAVLLGAAAPAAALIQGSSTASNCGEGGNWIDITFTTDEGVTLVDAWWDWNGTSVWLDASEIGYCPMENDGVTTYDFYFDVPVGTDTQDFGSTFTGFDGGDYFLFTMDLDLGSSGTPYGADLMGGTVTVEFSDATVLVGTFDTIYDGANGATASFGNVGPLPDFEFVAQAGWYDSLVPRNAADATWGSVIEPSALTGETATTWLNGAYLNSGDALGMSSRMDFHLDGVLLDSRTLFAISPGAWNGSVNVGPFTVPGGRHTLRVTADALGQVDESDETNNVYAVQYAWRGPDLGSGDILTRPAPPLYNQDFEYFSAPSWNRDGMRVTPDPAYDWFVVWSEALPVSGSAGNILTIHDASDDPATAFDLGFDTSRAGMDLQAIMVNKHTYGSGPWDVGVLRLIPADPDYRIGHLHESPYPFDFGIEPTTPYFANRVMMFQFWVDPADLGPATLTAYTDPDDGPVRMAWLAPDFTHGDLSEMNDEVVTGADGLASIELDLTETGAYCAVVYCNRDEHPGGMAVNVGLYGPMPDLVPAVMSGWHAPIVPRPAADTALFNVPAPDTLHGNLPLTWMNMCARNQGQADALHRNWAINRDGGFYYGNSLPETWAAGSFRNLRDLEPGGEPATVPGGRHTLSLEVDYQETVDESVERNNETSRQYCWSPEVLPTNAPLDLTYSYRLRDREGGWDTAPVGTTFYWNCDGLRMSYIPPIGGNWRWCATAVMPPTVETDIDLQLHAPLSGTQDGFGPEVLAESFAGDGQIDFVLVNHRNAESRPHDVGVLDDVDDYVHGYYAQEARSTWNGLAGPGEMGPYDMGDGRMLSLHEFLLDPGDHLFTLKDNGTGVDWGMSLYQDGEYHGKADVVTGAMVDDHGDGVTERMVVNVPAGSTCCLAVWKARTSEIDKEGSYSLWVSPGVSGAVAPEEAVPVVSRLVGAAPNPFNPRTTIAFELAQDGYCTLDVYDLQGRRVRTLVAEHRRAGRSEAVWNGLDDRGRRAASGVYLARFQAAGVNDLVKVTLVK